MIEPVTEGILQLFSQTIILYIILGPGEVDHGITFILFLVFIDYIVLFVDRPLDFSDLLYESSLSSKIFYTIFLCSSLLSACTSMAKASTICRCFKASLSEF